MTLRARGQTINGPGYPTHASGVPYGKAADANKKYPVQHMHNGALQRFEVRSGDYGFSGDQANGNERAELGTYRPGATSGECGPLYQFGVDFWLSFAFLIEPGADILSAPNGCCGQIHECTDPADTAGLSPPLLFNIGTGTDPIAWECRTRFDKNAATTSPNWMTYDVRWSTTLARGAWMNAVCRCKPGFNDDAEIQLWTDGVERINVAGTNIGFNHSLGAGFGYWQYGIYRTSSANTLAVRYANMEQGLTSLLGRVASPLAIPN